MKFKLVEQFDETRSMVQEYMYDAMDELNNASLEEYIQWFKSELTYYDDTVEQAVTNSYIEACDYGMIQGVEKTRLTSELKEYIESHTDIIDDTDELMKQCPDHLQHELKIVLSKLDESLNESVLEEAIRPDLKRFIEQHAELLDENNIEELYKQCPRELKIPLVRMLNAASLSDNIHHIKRATFLADFYDDDKLINLVLSVGEHANDVFDAFDYIMNNWDEFFTDDMLNEELLTEVQSTAQRNANKRYKNDINKIDTTINPADYVVHHLDKTNKIQLSNGETIQVTDKSNCVLLPKINKDSNVVHQAVHGALVCGGLDDYIRTLKNCEVIKQNEDNTISRISLEEFINNSIKN